MYLVLNSTDAARLQNRSALPDSPVVAQLARTARRDLLADLTQRLTATRRRTAGQSTGHRPGRVALSH